MVALITASLNNGVKNIIYLVELEMHKNKMGNVRIRLLDQIKMSLIGAHLDYKNLLTCSLHQSNTAAVI